jgi:short-subunit dehydrogenase
MRLFWRIRHVAAVDPTFQLERLAVVRIGRTSPAERKRQMLDSTKPLAVVTGASTGIGLELARHSAANGFNLVIVADEPEIQQAAFELRAKGSEVDAVEADLSKPESVDKLMQKIGGRSVDALLANVGRGLGHAFLETGVTVTCLMPAETETDLFERAGMEDTKLGQAKKADPADVAKAGFKAMMAGEDQVVPGWHAKFEKLLANITPAQLAAKQHVELAAPGTGKS